MAGNPGGIAIFRITKTFNFAAAHYLPNVADGHKCRRLHGHSYRVILGLEGALAPHEGWVQDYGEIVAAFTPLLARFDHICLNDLPGLANPTAEALARYIYDALRPDLPLLTDVTVCESETSTAIYRPGL